MDRESRGEAGSIRHTVRAHGVGRAGVWRLPEPVADGLQRRGQVGGRGLGSGWRSAPSSALCPSATRPGLDSALNRPHSRPGLAAKGFPSPLQPLILGFSPAARFTPAVARIHLEAVFPSSARELPRTGGDASSIRLGAS